MKSPEKMSEAELDIAIARLGNSAAVVAADDRIGYEAELFAMMRKISREGSPQQIEIIRDYIFSHRGQDFRPFINDVMGWKGLL